ncbi:MAG: CBS domain containing-hemolysin-like protein [Gammaproteobacteria bacterium]|jgi:CBS domain containing-hemolysin-like protein
MAFVVDEHGEFVGLVTIEDLLEEIVDATDEPAEEIAKLQSDGSWKASGLASLANLHREIGLAVPAELDANTLSGLLMQRQGRMPSAGDEVAEGDYLLRVLAMRDNHVDRVFINKVDDAPATAEKTQED